MLAHTFTKWLIACLWALLYFLGSVAQNPNQPTPQKVFTGVYLMNIYDINADAHSYYADFYLWFKWKGNIDPTNIEFVNMVEKWSATIEPFADTIETLQNGFNYFGWRVEGRFYHPFEMERFPLDQHIFDVQIENEDYPTDSLVYLPDPENATRQRPSLIVPGWNLGVCSIKPKTHHYATDFGNTDIGQHAYSNAVIETPLTRPVNYFLLKLMLPLVIVLLSSIGGLIIFPSRNYVDARISLPIGGLLTAVFLQLSYADALPDVGYMVLMDKIYLLAYTVIAAVVMEIILAANYLKHHKEANLKHLLMIERNLALFLIGGFVAGNLLLIFWN